MKRYPLASIRALRIRKEEEAVRKLAAARIAEQQAQRKVEESKKALDDYLEWIKKEAERLFGTILGGSYPIHKVMEITNQIAWNRSRQSTYVVAFDDAQEKLKEAEAYTAACLKEQEAAYKNVWKLNRHHDIWTEEERAREAYEEESDLEEIAAIIFATR